MEIKQYKFVYVEKATKNRVILYFDTIQQAENKRSYLTSDHKVAFVGKIEKIK